jgi:AcrR family transcriptional regulator
MAAETLIDTFPTAAAGGERARAAALDAAGELLVTRGLAALTFDAVAVRADVSRPAMHRWWPSEEALALDALHHEWVALAGHIRRGAWRFGLSGRGQAGKSAGRRDRIGSHG